MASDTDDELPLQPWQEALASAADRLSGPPSHAARHAFDHLRAAWRIKSIDPSMAAFRAITAEEEAATGLMLALKQMRYPGAERLLPRHHAHKSAFTPLIEAVIRVMASSGMPRPDVAITTSGKPEIKAAVDLAAYTGGRKPMWGTPDQPLNFVLTSGPAGEMLVHTFAEQFGEIAGGKGVGTFKAYVEQEANLRNDILYAGSNGRPRIAFENGWLLIRAQRVAFLTAVTVMVMQTSLHQAFVVQCLEAVLKGLERFNGVGHDFSIVAPPPDRQMLTIECLEGKAPVLKLMQTITVPGTRAGIWINPWLREWPQATFSASITF